MAYFYCGKNEKPNTAKTSGSVKGEYVYFNGIFEITSVAWDVTKVTVALKFITVTWERICCYYIVYTYLRVIDSLYYA